MLACDAQPIFSRSENKKAAAAAAADSEDSDAVSETDEPAPTSDVEMPDPVDDDAGSDDNKEEKGPEESKEKRSNGKETKSTRKGKGKGKGKGGVMMPDEWPWEDAKKIFEIPDVLPADEVEVCPCRLIEGFCLIVFVAGVEQP